MWPGAIHPAQLSYATPPKEWGRACRRLEFEKASFLPYGSRRVNPKLVENPSRLSLDTFEQSVKSFSVHTISKRTIWKMLGFLSKAVKLMCFWNHNFNATWENPCLYYWFGMVGTHDIHISLTNVNVFPTLGGWQFSSCILFYWGVWGLGQVFCFTCEMIVFTTGGPNLLRDVFLGKYFWSGFWPDSARIKKSPF